MSNLPDFTFADNMRLGLQVPGTRATGTSTTPAGFKRAVVDKQNGVAGEVLFISEDNEGADKKLGTVVAGYFGDDGVFVPSITAGAPIAGIIYKDGDAKYIQTGGVAYGKATAALTAGAKVYAVAATGLVSATSSDNVEIRGAVAGNPANKITIGNDNYYPIYLNNTSL